MAYTSADLDRIDKAISSGRLSVTIDGHSVTYRNLAELERIRAIVERALAGPQAAPRQIRITASSGLRGGGGLR
ncbi:MAG: hypothetical protein HY055_12670 [Magnetospirillum sp.]|nr:hypothetical protein [Magnetospirillum sp.]